MCIIRWPKGIQPPADLDLDGTDFTPALANKPIVLWAFYNALNGQQLDMRDGEWKVIAKLDHKNLHIGNEASMKAAKITNVEIYKINEDIAKAKNLASKCPEKLQELTKKLELEYQALLKGSHVWGK